MEHEQRDQEQREQKQRWQQRNDEDEEDESNIVKLSIRTRRTIMIVHENVTVSITALVTLILQGCRQGTSSWLPSLAEQGELVELLLLL